MVYLFISTFNRSVEWIKNCIPIEVGAAVRSEFKYPNNKDDIGENISFDNAYWGELSGLYWIWKNVDMDRNDIIGFGHYNKTLNVSIKDVNIIFSDRDSTNLWIASTPFKIVPHDYQSDVDTLKEVLKNYTDSKYYNAWNLLYDRSGGGVTDSCSGKQCFYTTASEFDKYCSFLFDILFLVRERIGDVDREPYHKRYCAFLGERLLSVYLMANEREVKYTNLIIPQDIFTKIIQFLTSYAKIILPESFYKKISNNYNKKKKNKKHRKSSYYD